MTALVLRAVWRLGVRPGRLTRQGWIPLLRAAFPFGVIGLTLGISYRFDTVLLNIFSGDVPTGHYNAAYNLVFALVTLSNVLNTALYPSLSRQAVTNPESLPKIYERLLRYLLLVALPIAVGGFILARPLVGFLFGPEYGPSAILLAILIWVVPLMFLSEFLGYVVVIAGREALVARAIMISSSVNIVANLVFIPRYGVLAAAMITVITELVLVGQYLWLMRDLLGQMRWGALTRSAAAVIAMAALVYAIRDLPVLVTVAMGGALYAGLLLAMRVVGPDEAAFVRSLIAARQATAEHRRSTPMKILLAVHHFPPRYSAGAELYTFRLARWLLAHGHAAEVVCVETLDAECAAGVEADHDTYEACRSGGCTWGCGAPRRTGPTPTPWWPGGSPGTSRRTARTCCTCTAAI